MHPPQLLVLPRPGRLQVHPLAPHQQRDRRVQAARLHVLQPLPRGLHVRHGDAQVHFGASQPLVAVRGGGHSPVHQKRCRVGVQSVVLCWPLTHTTHSLPPARLPAPARNNHAHHYRRCCCHRLPPPLPRPLLPTTGQHDDAGDDGAVGAAAHQRHHQGGPGAA